MIDAFKKTEDETDVGASRKKERKTWEIRENTSICGIIQSMIMKYNGVMCHVKVFSYQLQDPGRSMTLNI